MCNEQTPQRLEGEPPSNPNGEIDFSSANEKVIGGVDRDRPPDTISTNERSDAILPPGSIITGEVLNDFLPPGSITRPHPSGKEFRENLKAGMSGVLALGLWLLLGSIVVAHVAATITFSWELVKSSNANGTGKGNEQVEKATSLVGDTAKTLYSFLTPLATAVTGYYFTTRASSDSLNDADAD